MKFMWNLMNQFVHLMIRNMLINNKYDLFFFQSFLRRFIKYVTYQKYLYAHITVLLYGIVFMLKMNFCLKNVYAFRLPKVFWIHSNLQMFKRVIPLISYVFPLVELSDLMYLLFCFFFFLFF